MCSLGTSVLSKDVTLEEFICFVLLACEEVVGEMPVKPLLCVSYRSSSYTCGANGAFVLRDLCCA